MSKKIVFICMVVLVNICFLSCAQKNLFRDRHRQKQSLPSGNRVLVVLAHQDDEVFIASRILSHINRGDLVSIIWTATSKNNKQYKEIRIAESKHAIKLLGIDESNIYFLDYEDGKTHEQLFEIIYDIKEITSKIKPDVVYTHAYEGGHIDHDIANFAISTVIQNLELETLLFEYPTYSAYETFFLLPFKMRIFPDSSKFDCRELDPTEYKFITQLWDVFQSQKFPMGYYISMVSGKKLTFGYECIKSIPEYNYLEKPPNYKNIAYERYLFGTTFQDFIKAIKKYYNQRKQVK